MAAAAKSGRSAARPATSPTPERLSFTLSGPSRPLDHNVEAARRDLADVAVAGRWFAPHYAEPEFWTVSDAAELTGAPVDGDQPIGRLSSGDRFAVLEISGGWAWGYSERPRRVGYVRASALRPDGAGE